MYLFQLRDELAKATGKQLKAEHDREEAEMKIAEVSQGYHWVYRE